MSGGQRIAGRWSRFGHDGDLAVWSLCLGRKRIKCHSGSWMEIYAVLVCLERGETGIKLDTVCENLKIFTKLDHPYKNTPKNLLLPCAHAQGVK